MKVSLTLCASVLLATVSLGQADLATKIESPMIPSGTWVRPKFKLATTDVPPKIDGDLSDACWKTATKGQGFFRFPTKEAIDQQTEVWICSGKKSLYVAFHCLESNPESIKAKETQRNGNLDNDDRVLVLIDSQNSKRSASEFWVNANGTQLQNLEGGSADNAAWQGDWLAVTKRTSDGWIVEIEIPFSLLKYPKNTHQFGLFVARKKATESTFTTWPYVPSEGNGGNIAPYMSDFEGINPPAFAPKPVVSPYSLATTGQGNSVRFGMDIKMPFTTTMTGLATIKPDFSTVEGAVQDLSFSYTEKFVPDRRPFFAENGGFLDDQSLFYSQRISNVDYGFKVTGREGKTSLGLLSTMSNSDLKQYANIASFDHELGTFSGFGGTYMNSHSIGEGGQILQARASYGWVKGGRRTNFFASVTDANLDNGKKGKNLFAQVRSNAGDGNWNGNFNVSQTDSNFGNPLGLVSETNIRGAGLFMFRDQLRPKGAIESSEVYFGLNTYDHLDGSFFHNSLFAGYSLDYRSGAALGLDTSISNREKFHDQSFSPSISWNKKSLLTSGKVSVDFGHQQNKPYRYTSLSQGFAAGKSLSFNLTYGQLVLGSDKNWQAILSGTYRIDSMQSFGGRLVTQDGKSNLYLSYGKRTKKGNDIFLLLGDPNSQTTKRAITVKLVRTF